MLAQFPTKFQAGLSLSVEVEAPDHPAPEWTLSAVLRGPGQINLTATGADVVHTFAATPATTAAWAAGTYAVSIRAANETDLVEIEAGQIEIAPDLAALDAAHDPRGHAQRVLAAIEAVIENRATKDQQSYTIAGRSLQRTPIADLLALRAKYRREVAAEKTGRAGRLVGRTVKTRFL